MPIEADPPSSDAAPGRPAGANEMSFPLSTDINIVFSAYEDRLVLRSHRVNRSPVQVLISRRMVIIVLSQLLARLPELSGLDKTPAQYWQEVLQMAHQKALESGKAGHNPRSQGQSDARGGAENEPSQEPSVPKVAEAAAETQPARFKGDIYLATALTLQRREDDLIMAFTGLPMPCAMTEPCEREPLFAMPLRTENVHQLIQLLIDKAHEADWHLPLNLPWLESPPDVPATTLGTLH